MSDVLNSITSSSLPWPFVESARCPISLRDDGLHRHLHHLVYVQERAG